jgi:hypothetical protein
MVETQPPTTASQLNDSGQDFKNFTAKAHRVNLMDSSGNFIDSDNQFPVVAYGYYAAGPTFVPLAVDATGKLVITL